MNISLLRQMASFRGTRLILLAHAGQEFHWLDVVKLSSSMLNGIGSAILAYIGFHPFPIRFVLLGWRGR